MKLLHFLNRFRSEGGDISRLHVRRTSDPSFNNWVDGFQLVHLSGNRLTIRTNKGHPLELSAGHSILSGEVLSASMSPKLRGKGILHQHNSASIIVSLSQRA